MTRNFPSSIGGQSLTEFCVLMTALAPLVLLIPMLGKFLDLVQTAQVASRYVAFESLAHDPLNGRLRDEQIAADVARRFFNRSDAPIRTNERAGSSAAEQNGLWVDHRAVPMLTEPARDVSAITRVATRDPFPLARRWWNDALDLRARNLVSGSVEVRPAALPAVKRQTGLLVDDWSALGTRDVQLRIEHSGPAVYPTGEIDTLLTFAGQFPRLLTDEPLKPGLRDWEVVPCDRLDGGCPP